MTLHRPIEKPFSRADSRVVRVPGEFAGQDVEIEVYRNEWLAKTGRYRTMWHARMVGSTGWQASPSLRSSIVRAVCAPPNYRPRWVAAAVAEAKRKVGR